MSTVALATSQGSATIASAYMEGQGKARAHAVVGIRGGNLGNIHTINVASASAMDQKKRK
jgi:hypothetical protein